MTIQASRTAHFRSDKGNKYLVKPIICSALFAVLITEPVRAEISATQSKAIIENNISLPQTDYNFLLPQASESAATSLSLEMLKSIQTWIAVTFNLPIIHDQPSIQFEESRKIVSLRYPGVLSAPGIDNAAKNTIAVYSDRFRTIYLPKGWTGSTATELSVLVHEMVHHFQNVLGFKYECAQEREKLAYAAQDRWLDMFGENLESAFEIDPLSRLVRSKCMH